MDFRWLLRDLVQYGFTPDKIVSRLFSSNNTAPPVLANSMPKAGTNLLLRVLYLMPPLHRKFNRTLFNTDFDRLDKQLKRVHSGQIVAGHLYYTPELATVLRDLHMKHVFIVRDPRDIAVSNYVYITYKDQNHRLHRYFNDSLHSDEERLMASIVGIEANKLSDNLESFSINKHTTQYMPWIDNQDCLTVKFEDLIGSKGGGDKERQVNVLTTIANYLSLDLEVPQIAKLATQAFDTSSRTFFKGSIGSWKKHFTTEHRKAFKSTGGETLIKLGYESNMEW